MIYEEWVKLANTGSVTTVMESGRLLRGCPMCGGMSWSLTNDGWAYCDNCRRGFSTWGIWTRRPLVHYDENGFHCFMCRGTGKLKSGEVCDECGGEVTQPEATYGGA